MSQARPAVAFTGETDGEIAVPRLLLLLGAALLVPTLASAQEAVPSGTVTDTTGGVLPGVVVTAVHEASGNSFETVTDSAGGYRVPVRGVFGRMRDE
jgi:hypothetical protein